MEIRPQQAMISGLRGNRSWWLQQLTKATRAKGQSGERPSFPPLHCAWAVPSGGAALTHCLRALFLHRLRVSHSEDVAPCQALS